jgi:hypothetical protein
MSDILQTDSRLRAIFSWYRSSRYHSGAATPIPLSGRTELNQELKEVPLSSELRWFIVSLIVLTVVDMEERNTWTAGAALGNCLVVPVSRSRRRNNLKLHGAVHSDAAPHAGGYG